MAAPLARLVGDIGGTNSRLALFDPVSGALLQQRNYDNHRFAGLEAILSDWLTHNNEPGPQQCALAVAAPPSGDTVSMTNIDWSFSCRDLSSRFGFKQLLRLNDFEANAYALPHLPSNELKVLAPGDTRAQGRLATLGPGTGLGGAFLDWYQGKAHSFACEPGQMGLTPGNELELELFRHTISRQGSLHAEHFVSGPGLVRLYIALGEVRGEAPRTLEPADISRLACLRQDPLCEQTLETFCALLGSICGDFLLATGSYGGLYLAGGIVPGISDFLRESAFSQRLVEKGAMRDILAQIPVYAIIGGHPGLLGAARAPM